MKDFLDTKDMPIMTICAIPFYLSFPLLFTDNVKRSTDQFNTLFKTGKYINEIIKAVC